MLNKEIHEEFMSQVIALAKQGTGFVSPNPMVGALIVKNDKGRMKIIGRGFHRKFGDQHAEVEALKNCIEDPKGAILYVNLEPCCHSGKTGPCTKEIIKSGISEVFIGMKDPNPLVSGKGISELEKANIRVHCGILEKQCLKLNEIFVKWISYKKPFVTIKTASTLDGKISLEKNKKTILGNEKSWQKVYELRNLYDAILIGIDTVLIDNPRLTCRLNKKNVRNPIKIILDSNLRVNLDANIFKEEGQTIICCGQWSVVSDQWGKRKELEKMKNVKIWELNEEKEGFLDLNGLICKCSEENISSVLVEGGGTINSAFLNAGLVDKINIIYSPKISGKIDAPNLFANEILADFKFKDISITKVDDDLWWEGYIKF
ncbi:MAG: riboflavin biosynthesis protein RibD [Candidatus Peregrinibacteria bacterium GW2011_GWF2_33_10]|nr:MAG: riboflavin biosynthesis protein RibD [Candidatus Peregrinibacteria bacterium GW2011_GWF2_33_10]OGJ45830.1 MAG: riboflavin biosynthesis protein RibD [Candidatus Peregrinibacteria bacterium RIFOXYA2_FULL_33_21]OGJ46794.1 MAG: riboflavin biosynthesis protein RibD [Candidatus Peregrinibacteria bacterium RIFOXYA12_FULL_33_12]OGJ51379.1 MAG: riboflavin biosynthesis protein RibD [Candidatus Peregrinibacteria bacterium RIFOXYB2_FULL_33_20]